jgi:hypothetical protein
VGITIGSVFGTLVLSEAIIKILIKTHIKVLHIVGSIEVIFNMSSGYCIVELDKMKEFKLGLRILQNYKMIQRIWITLMKVMHILIWLDMILVLCL